MTGASMAKNIFFSLCESVQVYVQIFITETASLWHFILYSTCIGDYNSVVSIYFLPLSGQNAAEIYCSYWHNGNGKFSQ